MGERSKPCRNIASCSPRARSPAPLLGHVKRGTAQHDRTVLARHRLRTGEGFADDSVRAPDPEVALVHAAWLEVLRHALDHELAGPLGTTYSRNAATSTIGLAGKPSNAFRPSETSAAPDSSSISQLPSPASVSA